MKRAIFILLLCSGASFAQVHGVPPSVTSFTGRGMAPGVPASVTSLGPRGYSTGPCLGVLGCTNPFFQTTIDFRTGTVVQGGQMPRNGKPGHHHRGQGQGVVYYPYVYSYPYPVPVAAEPEPEYPEEEQPEPPAPTVFERRSNVRPAPNPTPVGSESRYSDRYAEPRERPPVEAEALTGGHHNMSPVSEEAIPIVLVFKDGHEQQIGNYAIVGDTLYDIGTFVAHKIKLADVDLKTTIQKNEDRGVEFTVPQSLKPKA